MYKILVVDDDFEILKLMRTILEMKNYDVTTYQEITLPLNSKDFQGFDLILLDVMMPDIDGLQVCRQIRDKVSAPIIFVSAKDEEDDIVTGLNLGGDDYITKPFSVKQLVAKVAAHLKREERFRQAESDEKIIRELLPITFYLQEKTVCVNGNIVPLTSREYDLLDLLSANRNKVFTREDIYSHIYDDEADALFRSISEYVYQIRVKFSAYDINPIKTVRGMGYKWYD
ncbi:response regulator transcription factor [Streptococcus equinus]|uniref:DNA-binding response regulator, OmpR family, contains REC and winged-helix (WHTH) domain n=1 Tax=Streptococcus equinus TaxID=1335 RepID=A0A1G9K513_STREI|nr:response regulator transcription factor [Streptococcus equinus]SDL44514.1 DNA-binding response regulator, OmpR family, contains REC and winged-helix (wHTH) domain [Streptococcus equinus]SFF78394.1 DNA-binding response regulator, OmpR family, contains REC and winged-helix (wHTH) domain [Streptococcus equinus]